MRAASRYNVEWPIRSLSSGQWRVRLKPDTSRDPWFSHKTWKQLRWRMSEADAVEWADKNGCEIEKIPHSGKQSTGYLGMHGPSAPSPDKRNS